jgi:DUF4097 and DUF4098 domain-containing protein YvlB
VLLIAAGSGLLLSNLLGWPLWQMGQRAFLWFTRFWPLILVLWGVLKIYQRYAHPEAARVGAGEVFLLILVILAGASLSSARFFLSGLPIEEFIDAFIPDYDQGRAHRFESEETWPLAEGAPLSVENGRGSVTIEGGGGPELVVKLTKRVFTYSEDKARAAADSARLEFSPAEGDATARLRVRLSPERDRDDARIATDLEIRLPGRTPVSVANGRGAVRVSRLQAAVTVATAYDAVEIEDIQGTVRVDSRHGRVRIASIVGDVEASAKYDALIVDDVEGDLLAESANGELSVEDVSGRSRLRNRYARVRAARIGGELVIEAANAEVTVEETRSAVSIETSYQPIFVRGAGGRLTVETRNSEVEVRDIAGDVDLRNRYRPVTLAGVRGGVTLDVRQCAVYLAAVDGPIKIDGSYEPIEIESLAGSLTVATEHAPVSVSLARWGGDVNIVTSYATVDLSLPPEGSFRLEAVTEGGRVENEYPYLNPEPGSGAGRLRGSSGPGAVPIRISTSHANIRLAERPRAEAERRER